LTAATTHRGPLAIARDKFDRLRDFALFRSPGARAVLRGGQGAPRSRDQVGPNAPRRRRDGVASSAK
jgi:hypothetical protein